ncbi:MAG: zinc-binding alcohol dehydrogenase family protein [Alphaproteobacteria bacterium]|nr:zinc-binding alcohol dehydrogenase family protein [Alphaproteobacteria bacterium]
MNLRIEMSATGGPDGLKPTRAPMPEPGRGEVVIHMTVAGVNPDDLRRCNLDVAVPGVEACGRVLLVGRGVDAVKVGDEVLTAMQGLGERYPGGYQRLVTLPADTLAVVPEALSLEDAGTLGLPALSAWLLAERMGLRGGHELLIDRADSAIGQMLIQVARCRGARVVAVAAHAENMGLLRDCGAQEVLGPDDRLGADPFDRVLQQTSGPDFATSVQSMADGGQMIYLGPSGVLQVDAEDLRRGVSITGWSPSSLTAAQIQRALDALSVMFIGGRLKVRALHRVTLVNAAQAHKAIERGAPGRVVLY